MHEQCNYLKDKENILAEREALFSLLQEINSKVELTKAQNDLRLNAILSQAQKNEEQDEKINEIERLINAINKRVENVEKTGNETKEKVEELKEHINNGWKLDLINKIYEKNLEMINKVTDDVVNAKLEVYVDKEKKNTINWKYEFFKFFVNSLSVGGIIYLIVANHLKQRGCVVIIYDNERDYKHKLILAVLGEAEGESFEEKFLIACVGWARYLKKKHFNSIEKDFLGYTRPIIIDNPLTRQAFLDSCKAVEEAFIRVVVERKPLYSELYFFNRSGHPPVKNAKAVRFENVKHIFFTIPDLK